MAEKIAASDAPNRSFGGWTGLFVVIASMVGVGILTTSGYTMHATGSHAALLLLWAVGGLLALCGAMTVTEMAVAAPRVGGDYVFVRMAYGPAWGFVYGWATLLFGFAGPIGVVAYAASEYMLASLRPVYGDRWAWVDEILFHPSRLATFWVLAFTFAHCQGAKESSAMQMATTVFKIATLLFLVAAGLAFGQGDYSHLTGGVSLLDTPPAPLAVGLIYVMYSYTGWNAAAYLAGEIKEPARMLPRCLIGGCAAVTTLYLLLNLVYAYALDPIQMQQMPIEKVAPVAELAATNLFGPGVASTLSMVIGVGVLASLSAFVLTGPRVAMAMSRDGLLPEVAGALHAAKGTPIVALTLQALVAVLFLQIGTFRQLLDMTSVGLALMSGLMVSSVFVLRRRPELTFPFRMPLYPLPPILYLCATAWMVVYAVASTPAASLVCLGSIFLAVPLYRVLSRRVGEG